MRKRFIFSAIFTAILSVILIFNSVSVSAASLLLTQGMQGSEVTNLQSNLKKLGLFSIDPTGYYGNITASSVKKLQANYGITADGVAGYDTFALINRLLGKIIPSATKPTSVKPVVSRGDSQKQFVVVIDPGHGGSEPGAIEGSIKEKTLNLAIAKKLNTLLQASGIKTYMTRDDDTYVDLYDRSGLANNVKADLLISIHNNACASTSTTGSMSLYFPGGNNSNGNLTAKEFATIVQKQLNQDLGTNDQGVIERPHLAVLRTATMPAVIAEVGFMTNKNELATLESSSYQQSTAEALKTAVLEALNDI